MIVLHGPKIMDKQIACAKPIYLRKYSSIFFAFVPLFSIFFMVNFKNKQHYSRHAQV